MLSYLLYWQCFSFLLFQICEELFGAGSENLLKDFFEETVAPFAVANQRNECTEPVKKGNQEASVGPNMVKKFKDDVLEFITNGEQDEVWEIVTKEV